VIDAHLILRVCFYNGEVVQAATPATVLIINNLARYICRYRAATGPLQYKNWRPGRQEGSMAVLRAIGGTAMLTQRARIHCNAQSKMAVVLFPIN
jgi:hypothetical protein